MKLSEILESGQLDKNALAEIERLGEKLEDLERSYLYMDQSFYRESGEFISEHRHYYAKDYACVDLVKQVTDLTNKISKHNQRPFWKRFKTIK